MSDWRPLVEALPSVEHDAGKSPVPTAHPSIFGGVQPDPRPMTPFVAGQTLGASSPPATPQSTPSLGPAHDEQQALVRAEVEALGLRYRAAIEDLVTAREHVMRGAEGDMVRLALTIAKETMMSDSKGREGFVEKMVAHALSLMGQTNSVTLRLHPDDLAALKRHKPELLTGHGVEVIEDLSLALGGCVAEGPLGRIDASLESRLGAMAKKLLGEASGSIS